MRGWCSMHYNRWILHGNPEPIMQRIVGDDEKRFFSKVLKTETCWVWQAKTRTRGGYPLFSVARRWKMASRVAYEWFVGPIPDDFQIDHLCRNITCVRPDHLEAVTQAENRRRQSEAAGAIGRRCELPGCDRPYRTTGMCNMHYVRSRRGQLT
ncbi:HNH endonuclease signature motif containing protein [Nonomuraea sp. NPDC049486]|uniref:HNH endonuclease signature motif containing protein n=1 Tax=Nonomuraea sp. NPDC049486 TaxID=3155773 RepID=UPI00341DEEAD